MDPNGNNQIATTMDSATPQSGLLINTLIESKMPVLFMKGDTDVLMATSHSWGLN
jgi:hypothetical protein